jgi:hypothetical protein
LPQSITKEMMTKELKRTRIASGDLVFMYRRRSKGLGLVTEYIDDVSGCLGTDAESVFSTYESFISKEWQRRDKFRKEVCQNSTNQDLAFDFFIYNIAFKGRLKTKFAFVQWFKRPSTFAADGFHATSGWIPAEWLRCY